MNSTPIAYLEDVSNSSQSELMDYFEQDDVATEIAMFNEGLQEIEKNSDDMHTSTLEREEEEKGTSLRFNFVNKFSKR